MRIKGVRQALLVMTSFRHSHKGTKAPAPAPTSLTSTAHSLNSTSKSAQLLQESIVSSVYLAAEWYKSVAMNTIIFGVILQTKSKTFVNFCPSFAKIFTPLQSLILPPDLFVRETQKISSGWQY